MSSQRCTSTSQVESTTAWRRPAEARGATKWIGLTVFVACSGCGSSGQLMSVGGLGSSQLPRIVQKDFDRHPKLVSLVRGGDPASALVLRIGTGEESLEATADLAAVLSTRLPDAEVVPDLGGLTISMPVSGAAQLRAGATRIDAAVRRRIGRAEIEGATFQKERTRFARVLAYQASHSDRAYCLGQADPSTTNDLERFRQKCFQSELARWSVVGAREIVEAAESELRGLPTWPSSEAATTVWPSRNITQLNSLGGRSPRIDITLRMPEASRCLAISRQLRSPSNQLVELLSALPTAMRLERVVAMPLSQGGYLGLSITPESEFTTSTLDDLLFASRLAINELQRLASTPTDPAAAILAILDESDPRSAARLASLVSLSIDARSQPVRFRVEVDPGVETSPTSEQRDTLASLAAHSPRDPNLALLQAVERGQGQVHALLASPCATWDESAKLVGVTGFLMRVLAGRYHDVRGTVIEPWVTSNGVGLMAHAGRESIAETPTQHAARVGDVLGRVLATMRIDPQDVWRTRTELLSTLGPGSRPALWRTILAFSPQQPGPLLPDGTFSSVEAISISDLRDRRTRLMRLPWRLAVLANEDEHQAESLRQATMHWLSLVRQDSGKCPSWQEPATLMQGEIRHQSKDPDANDAAITMALSLPAGDGLDDLHSTLLVWLLNRPTGWLSERLRSLNVVGSVEARIVGGTKRRGLVIAVGALPSAVDSAVSGIRTLFEDLGTGRIPQDAAFERVISEMGRAERDHRFAPRVRLEDLWLGRVWDAKVSEKSMREYLRRTFSSSNVLVMRAERAGVEVGNAGGSRH